MAESYSLAPIWFIDVFGSMLMILFSFLSVWYASRLRKIQPSNVVWTYLLWLCVALAGFAVSRGVGHVAKRFLLLADRRDLWLMLKPYSGAINSIAFVVVASITLFFQRVQRINTAILNDKKALEEASAEVMRLNSDLESLVQDRTRELAKSERKYRRIFEGSMDMIFILDSAARFVDINRSGLTTLGYNRREDLIGTHFAEILAHREDCDRLIRDLDERGFVRDREYNFITKNGSLLNVLLSATGRKNEVGEIESYEGIAKDITERVHMERQLQRADKLASLGQISTGIAHEINNPLGVMLGYTQLLLRDHSAGTQIHDDLKTIEKHARNCKTVVEDLLKFARSTTTRKDPVRVNECLDEVVSLLAHQFELDNVTVIKSLSLDLPEIIADGEKLKQVFMNLLMNARHAIAGKGVISIRTEPGAADNHVRITISDTGCGIPGEFIGKIFDPFFTTKPVGEGTGLGLSVSYGIIQDHNGTIEVESVPGEGSTFTVSLPVPAGVKSF
ncbi:MAG TPA: ATP-binding protein [Desulfomonilaceae bacterium]|nr:ATP-binding protein [Desulfomonilaceae bacterium]